MKKFFLLSALSLMLFAGMLNAQTGTNANDIISKDNVTLDKLRTIFENSYLEIKETGTSYFTMKDVYSIYVDLDDKDNRYITLSVNWTINDATMQDKFELLNRIGKDVLLVTPYYNDAGTSLIIKTTIWIEGGIVVKNIVMTEKLFVKALNLVLDKDPKKIIQ